MPIPVPQTRIAGLKRTHVDAFDAQLGQVRLDLGLELDAVVIGGETDDFVHGGPTV